MADVTRMRQVVCGPDASLDARGAVIGGHDDICRFTEAKPLIRLQYGTQIVVRVFQRPPALGGGVAARVHGVIGVRVPEHHERRHQRVPYGR